MSPNQTASLGRSESKNPVLSPKRRQPTATESTETAALKRRISELESKLRDAEEKLKSQEKLHDEEIRSLRGRADGSSSGGKRAPDCATIKKLTILKSKEDELEKQKTEYEKQLKSKEDELNRLKKEHSCSNSNKSTVDEVNKKIQILDKDTIESYEKVQKINSGGFGDVYKVSKSVFYALKVLKNEVTTDELRYFLSEYEIMNMLDHPNIVEALGLYLSETEPPSILLEYCPTNVSESIKKGTLAGVLLVFCIYQIAEGMKYVHFRHVIHRDLKPTNILIGKDGLIKISDFGISKLMTAEEQSMTLGIGTLSYMAPEIIDNNEHYDEKVDVYSLGVLIFFILSGGQIPKIKLSEILRGKKAEIPSSFTDFARSLINECWNFEPTERPSFTEILEKLEQNDYKLIELSKSEVKDIRSKIKEHKKKIPKY